MTSKKSEINWQEVWSRIAETLERHHAPKEVIDAVDFVEWKVKGDTFFIFCTRKMYQWIEVPASAGEESNIRYIKPILWPAMQRLGCSTLVYKMISDTCTTK